MVKNKTNGASKSAQLLVSEETEIVAGNKSIKI